MGFLEILTLIFIVLKLTSVICWSWVLVLSPALLSLCIYIIIGVFVTKILGKGGGVK